jgi:hypothetical protein
VLESDNGVAIVLLNWTNEDVSILTVRIPGAGPFTSATSVQRGSIPQDFNNGNTLLPMPLSNVDIMMLKK